MRGWSETHRDPPMGWEGDTVCSQTLFLFSVSLGSAFVRGGSHHSQSHLHLGRCTLILYKWSACVAGQGGQLWEVSPLPRELPTATYATISAHMEHLVLTRPPVPLTPPPPRLVCIEPSCKQ